MFFLVPALSCLRWKWWTSLCWWPSSWYWRKLSTVLLQVLSTPRQLSATSTSLMLSGDKCLMSLWLMNYPIDQHLNHFDGKQQLLIVTVAPNFHFKRCHALDCVVQVLLIAFVLSTTMWCNAYNVIYLIEIFKVT